MSDYIKRSLVKAQFTGTFNDEYPVSLCKTLIDEVSSADVEEVKHGSWKGLKPDNRGYTEKFQCSECKCITTLYLYQQECDYEYCPNCGAKMDKEK